MDLQQAISHMSAAGVVIQARGDRLTVESRTPLTDRQRLWIRVHKADLLCLVSDPPHSTGVLSDDDRTAVQEAIDERAAIREFESGESRAVAEHQARTGMHVYRYRLTDNPGSWLTLICPGCDLEQARHVLDLKFGDRLAEAVEYHYRRKHHA